MRGGDLDSITFFEFFCSFFFQEAAQKERSSESGCNEVGVGGNVATLAAEGEIAVLCRVRLDARWKKGHINFRFEKQNKNDFCLSV